jgi:hypothetical protein
MVGFKSLLTNLTLPKMWSMVKISVRSNKIKQTPDVLGERVLAWEPVTTVPNRSVRRIADTADAKTGKYRPYQIEHIIREYPDGELLIKWIGYPIPTHEQVSNIPDNILKEYGRDCASTLRKSKTAVEIDFPAAGLNTTQYLGGASRRSRSLSPMRLLETGSRCQYDAT